MTCAKVPPESWALQCVKKAPHGAELCNHKKKREREISPAGSLARAAINCPDQDTCQCCHWFWVSFSSDCAFFSKSLTLRSRGHQRGQMQSFAARRAGQQYGLRVTSLTHADIPNTCSPAGFSPSRKLRASLALPNPQSAIMSHLMGGTLS